MFGRMKKRNTNIASEPTSFDLMGRFVPKGEPSSRNSTFEQVSERAYAIYLESGARTGHDLDDWLLAERQVKAEIERKM